MRVAFRADASPEIGTGHVMRCLTLARKLCASGASVCFSGYGMPENLLSEIQQSGMTTAPTGSLSATAWDWLVVDHYGLDAEYESSMRPWARKILVIDDLANRPHDCDLLLDQNLYARMEQRYQALMPGHAVSLCGPRFALLRPEFLAARSRVERRDAVRRILVFFGGSDPTNETSKVLRALRRLQLSGIEIDILIGGLNPNGREIERLASQLPGSSVRHQTDAIAELMANADLAVGGGGATSWERCCLGLPTIAVAVADNQIAISKSLADFGYQEYLGIFDAVPEQLVADTVSRCISNYQDIRAKGLRGMKLVDGLGTERVAVAMEKV